MIDWITARLACRNTLKAGHIFKLKADGEIEWHTQTSITVEGSYSSHIIIKPLSENIVMVSGNPAKWLQGHNLFGSNDLLKLFSIFFDNLVVKLNGDLTPTISQLDDIRKGEYTLTRVDINETWFLDNLHDVKAFIRSAGEKMHMPHRGKGVFSGDTLYWGKGSKYWFVKCYSKGDEISQRKSNFPEQLKTAQMLDYANRALRFELVLCSNFLRQSMLCRAYHWNEKTARMLLLTYVRKLEMSGNFMLRDEIIDTLPTRLKMAYNAWLNGADLRTMLPKNTFYRYRRELKKYDIDIALVRDKEQVKSNVIPLIRILEAEPVGVPEWAYEQGLVAC